MIRWVRLLAALAICLAAPLTTAQNVPLLSLDGARVDRVVVSAGAQAPPAEIPASPMLRRVAGILDVLEGPRLTELSRCVPRNPPPIGRPPDALTVGYLHLSGGGREKTLEVSRDPTGLWVAEEQGEFEERPPRAELNPVRFERLSEGWAPYLGGFDASGAPEPRGLVFEAPRPYVSHRLSMDAETMGDRVAGGARWRHDGCERDLADETFHARLPKGYDPRRPAGVLVWVDPTDEVRVPAVFHEAADELNLICISPARVGNHQPIARRLQLALDAAATAARRWHTDPERVYITGMSGGGRLSSIALGCFPDVFTGAVPIVGLSVYEAVPMGTGAYWRPEYARPRLLGLFKTRRICSITGDGDFNEREMVQATRVLKDNGIPARVIDVPGLGHEMPTAATFREALAWVDEPVRLAAEEREREARSLLDEHAAAAGETLTPKARAALERVTVLSPWGESAWKAVEMLR